MIEYDLVQKEADPLNMNLIDLACPKRGCQVTKNLLPQIEIMPPTWRYNRNNRAELLKLFLRRNV